MLRNPVPSPISELEGCTCTRPNLSILSAAFAYGPRAWRVLWLGLRISPTGTSSTGEWEAYDRDGDHRGPRKQCRGGGRTGRNEVAPAAPSGDFCLCFSRRWAACGAAADDDEGCLARVV